ncbi:MAG: arylsulfotransferase family protein [Geminicoccaceae bacterium]
MLSWLRRHIDTIVFSTSLLVLVFGFGVAVGKFRIFPHDQINEAVEAAKDWWEHWRHFARLESKWLQPTHRTERITWRDPARTHDGYTFVTGYLDGAAGVYLIDMEGNIVHRWPFSMDEMWKLSGMPAENLGSVDLSIHGAVLYPDGDVVLAVGGGALSRVDRCGNFVYATAMESHHAVDLLPDGSVLTLGRHTETGQRDDRPLVDPGPNGYYLDDTLAHVSPEGEILYERSLIDILFDSDMAGMLLLGGGSSYRSTVQDPLHVNDVEYLTAELAPSRCSRPATSSSRCATSPPSSCSTATPGPSSGTRPVPFFGQHDPDFARRHDRGLRQPHHRRSAAARLFARARDRRRDPRGRLGVCRHRRGPDVQLARRPHPDPAQRQRARPRPRTGGSSRSRAAATTASSGNS